MSDLNTEELRKLIETLESMTMYTQEDDQSNNMVKVSLDIDDIDSFAEYNMTDWRDSPDTVLEQIARALKEFGLKIYYDDDTGHDQYFWRIGK